MCPVIPACLCLRNMCENSLLLVNSFQIFTLCKNLLLSCNATQGGVNILTQLLQRSDCLLGLVPVLGVAALPVGANREGLNIHKQVYSTAGVNCKL